MLPAGEKQTVKEFGQSLSPIKNSTDESSSTKKPEQEPKYQTIGSTMLKEKGKTVKHANDGVVGKSRRRGRRKRQRRSKDSGEVDEASRLQRRARNLMIKMKYEQNLIDAYSGEGWKGQR